MTGAIAGSFAISLPTIFFLRVIPFPTGIRLSRYVRSAVDIRASQKAPDSSPIFQRVNLRAPQLKRDTGDRGAPQKQ
nr:MAG TPA: hypothetical protein [Caudoviricetes sp.]